MASQRRQAVNGQWYTMEQFFVYYQAGNPSYYWDRAVREAVPPGASQPGSSQRAGRRAAGQDAAHRVRFAAEPVAALAAPGASEEQETAATELLEVRVPPPPPRLMVHGSTSLQEWFEGGGWALSCF